MERLIRLTIKNDDGTYSALANGYEEGVTEEVRHFHDIVQKLGKYEDICYDPDLLRQAIFMHCAEE